MANIDACAGGHGWEERVRAPAMTTRDDQYSHPSEAELQAILARAQIDLQLARAGDKAAEERYRYRGIEPVRLYHSVAIASAAAVARVSHTAYAPSIHEMVKRGQRIIDWIWRWSVIPLVGPIVMSRLADQLDRLTDALAKRVPE